MFAVAAFLYKQVEMNFVDQGSINLHVFTCLHHSITLLICKNHALLGASHAPQH